MSEMPIDERGRQYQIVARAIQFVRANAHRQPSLAEIANAVNMSEHHLQRVFVAWAGISPKRFLQFLTKERAKRALRESADILQATLSAGLSSPGRLHDLMVSCEAMSPGEIKTGGKGLTIGYGVAATPFGDALFGWTPRGVCYLAFCDAHIGESLRELTSQWPAASLVRDDEEAERLSRRIFPAAPESGKLHLLLRGTNFQLKVWEALLNTKPAQVISYSQLAAMVGAPNARRAVGSALAGNNISFLIPCHRVIRGSGELGIYRWGSDRKMAIQAWEAGRNRDRSR